MTQIDQFESAFKAAAKTRFCYEPVSVRKVLVITDLEDYEARLFSDRIRAYLEVLGDEVDWQDAHGGDCRDVGSLLEKVEEHRPDLICTYRNLHSGGWRWPYSLGEHLDVLTQVTTTPVLVVPRPDTDNERFHKSTENTNSVMAITNHLAGDARLVNFAIRFTEKKGTLRLTHIESVETFERVIDAISKIPAINTDLARKEILKRLLKEPCDYIESCVKQIDEHELPISVKSEVTLGDQLDDYKRLIGEHEVDLLVLNTKDADQLAMHGLAYPLAIELRHTALLML
ncbi:MAG: hypothetical protein CSA65_08000 [Proteobacteria bacterium]|nr:MAG: hypothetical protein CSA65_08000 [Pseudomonadota bacterium]